MWTVLDRRTSMVSPPYTLVEEKEACPAWPEMRCLGMRSQSCTMPLIRKEMPLILSLSQRWPLGTIVMAWRRRRRRQDVNAVRVCTTISAVRSGKTGCVPAW